VGIPAEHAGKCPSTVQKLERVIGAEHVEALFLLSFVFSEEKKVFEKNILANRFRATSPLNELEFCNASICHEIEWSACVASPE
jgi:hypothetical protein